MIAKHIAMKSARQSSFGGLVAYIASAQGKTERLGEIRLSNLVSDDVEWATREALATQAQNTRAASDKTYHLLISFAPEDAPTADVLRAIEDRISAALGFTEHQRISAVHHDTDSLHIHIAINKIHPVRLTLHEPYRAYRTLAETCTALEAEFGLRQVDHKARKTLSQNRANDMERHAGVESLLGWLQRECLEQMQAARSWHELHGVMQENGLQLRARGNGLVVETDAGLQVKASSVARDFSRSRLEARLGPFEPAAREGRPAVRRRYAPRPLRSRIDTSQLYAAYQVEQSEGRALRSTALQSARAQCAREIEAAKRLGRLKRAAIKLLGGSAANKRMLYALASRALLADIRKAREAHRRAREQAGAAHARRTWADWLRAKAMQGDVPALQALRARDLDQGLKGDTLAGAGAGAPRGEQPPTADPARDGVTKHGTVVFVTANAAVRDDGSRIKVSRGADREGLVAALRFVAARYGARIEVGGSAKFQTQIAVAAATARLPITFAQADLERRRQALVQVSMQKESLHGEQRIQRPGTGRGDGIAAAGNQAGRGHHQYRAADHRKPDAGQAGREPPPAFKNGLRDLSQRPVVRFAGGSEVLLPRNVHRHLEHGESQPHHGVRRPVSRLSSGLSGRAATLSFVAGREANGGLAFDIPNYSLYTAGIETSGSYAGCRQVDGQPLALLRHEGGVAAVPLDAAAAARLKRLALGASMTITAEGAIRTKGRGR